MSVIGICMVKLQKFADYQTWDDEEGKLVTRQMHDVIVCDGCGRQMHNVLDSCWQITCTTFVMFVCEKCKRTISM